MPTRAPRPCTTPGCPVRPPAGGKCPDCRRRRAQPNSTERARAYNAPGWRELSEDYRRRRPTCEARGCTRPSAHTDHIDGDNTNWHESNLQALCHRHHSRKTVQVDGGFGRPKLDRRA